MRCFYPGPSEEHHPHHGQQGGRGLALVAVTSAVVAPTSAWAASRYRDVQADPALEAAVDYLADNAITAGCTAGEQPQFSAEDALTRRQMALFPHRMSGDGPVPPSVDARTVQGLAPDELRGRTGPAGPQGTKGDARPVRTPPAASSPSARTP